MIPKVIHYCWFGRKPKPKLAEKCIASWKKYCPDYEITEWNEDNFDVNQYAYTKFCYDNKLWAYLSDFVRLEVVFNHGGIYFDTDVEVIRTFDDLLKYDAFYGFENASNLASGLGFGAVKNHRSLEMMRNAYLAMEPDQGGKYTMVGCPRLNTDALKKYGITVNGQEQCVGNVKILPVECLNPYDDATGRLNKTDKTYSIHWFAKSALSRKTILISKLTRPFHRLFGPNCFNWLKPLLRR